MLKNYMTEGEKFTHANKFILKSIFIVIFYGYFLPIHNSIPCNCGEKENTNVCLCYL